MFRTWLVIGLVLIFAVSGFAAQIKPATKEEIQQTISTINQYIDSGRENIVEIYSNAIEIEKRAVNPYLAEVIAKKILSSSKISEKEFNLMRKSHSFSEISIAWAISQIGKVPIKKVLEEIENSTLEDVLEKYACGCQYISAKILELNPEKKVKN